MKILDGFFRRNKASQQSVGAPAVGTAPVPAVSLHQAALLGDISAINRAIANRVPIDSKDKSGLTPLAIAAAAGQTEAASVLIINGADVNATDPSGATPLILAVGRTHTKVVKLLLENGANANAQWIEGCTPLFFATDKSVAEMLIRAGADVQARARDESTALIAAAKGRGSDIVEALISHGADLNVKDKNGLTPLIGAAVNGNYGAVSVLVSKGVQLDMKDNNGVTALHVAAHKGERGIVGLLLAAGADRHAKASDGSSPAGLAELAGHAEIANLLLSNRVSKRTFSVPGIPDLAPSDVKLGSPEISADAQKSDGWFHIETPEGAFICLEHQSKRGARLCVEELQKYLSTHAVSGNQASIYAMLAEVDRSVMQRMNEISTETS